MITTDRDSDLAITWNCVKTINQSSTASLVRLIGCKEITPTSAVIKDKTMHTTSRAAIPCRL